MRIQVTAEPSVDPQALAYAEYRVFAALTRLVDTALVRDARIVLRSPPGADGDRTVSCAVAVTLDPDGDLRVSTTGGHVYAAINRAVECLERTRLPGVGTRTAADHHASR